jgi:hypothetical protein
MEAREGDAARGLGEPLESELSSGGGVGGSIRDFAGTDRERNLGIGRADGAGEAWKVGPAYAPWFLAGVDEMGIGGGPSVSVKEPEAPGGENIRSTEGWDCVCFFGWRGPVLYCTSSLVKTALSANAGFAKCAPLLGDMPTWLCWVPLLGARPPLGRRCPCRPLLLCGACAAADCAGCCLPRGARGDAVTCAVDI